VDTDRAALAVLSRISHQVHVVTHVADFTADAWPSHGLDGVMMANALHYVRQQDAFLAGLVAAMEEPKVLLVEYDTETANPWVPFPLSRQSAARRLADAGLRTVIDLGRRASVIRRAPSTPSWPR
jgi:hypothetical protein